MSETILLVIFAALVLLIIFGVRVVMKSRKIEPLSSRNEALIRIGLCILFAFIAFVIYHSVKGVWDGVTILVSALIIYAVTHLADRFVLK